VTALGPFLEGMDDLSPAFSTVPALVGMRKLVAAGFAFSHWQRPRIYAGECIAVSPLTGSCWLLT